MLGTELHVQASLWKHCWIRERSDRGHVRRAVVPPGHGHWARETDLAVLVMAGEAPGRTTGGAPVADALCLAVQARGLAMTTDLDHLDLRPRPGWRVVVDEDGAVTVEWPHTHPLLSTAPVELPAGWREAAAQLRVVVVVAGTGRALSTPAGEHLAPRLDRAARAGALAAGAAAYPQPARDGDNATSSNQSVSVPPP